MKKIERIMVVVDADEDFSAQTGGLPIELRKALRFVDNKASTEIKLLSVAYEKSLGYSFQTISVDYASIRQEFCDQLSSKLKTLLDQLSADGYNISSQVSWAHPRYEAIVQAAEDFGADLLVQHCRVHGKVKQIHLTHDSWQLVKHCSLPLLLVKDREWGEQPVLMAAVDPMHAHEKPAQLDAQIMAATATVNARLGGEFHVVHAYAESARPFTPVGEIKEEHSKAFNEFIADYNLADDKKHLIDETPVFALGDSSDKLNADIIVMGAMSRSRIAEALIGSTAEDVLDFVASDILIISPSA